MVSMSMARCLDSFTFQTSVFETSISPLSSVLVLPQKTFFALTFSAKRTPISSFCTVHSKKRNKRSSNAFIENDADPDEDAFEKLFSMLEEDLNNDELGFDEEDDITEEEMDKLQAQFEEVLGISADDETSILSDHHEDQEDLDEDIYPKLKTWQLRRLAFALKTGRRKLSIKNLATELCLDRTVVLKYLREPPPVLLLMTAELPDEPAPRMVISERNATDATPTEEEIQISDEVVGDDAGPIHAMRQQWSAQKRIKKAHLETLERVYRRTKRPTNAMISSIIQVTNLPRKKVVKWFEDKRSSSEDSSSKSSALARSVPETISSG